jgi:thiol-disulfide isomerase/thioredoxin
MSRPNRVLSIADSGTVALVAWSLTITGYGGDSAIAAAGVAVLNEPSPAAPLALQRLDGTPVSSSSLRGRVVVLDVWATWCGPCLTEMPRYNQLYDEFRNRGVEVLGVAVQSGSAPAVEQFISGDRFQVDYPVAMGTADFEKHFGPLWGLPTTLLIDSDWQVRKRWIGAVPTKHEELRILIDRLLDRAAAD